MAKKPAKKSGSNISPLETGLLFIFAILVIYTWLTGQMSSSSTPATATATATAVSKPSASATPTTTPQPTQSATPTVSPSQTGNLGDILTALAAIAVNDTPPSQAYNRDYFKHWVDADKDGCTTRSEVLKLESQVPVAFSSGCTVSTGKWWSAYDNLTITDGTTLDIDHFVPLAEAWRSGADKWTAQQREAYANDLQHPWALIAVTAKQNRSKADQDPAQWMPPYAGYRCTYLATWVKVKATYKLTMDTAEKSAVTSGLKNCNAADVSLATK